MMPPTKIKALYLREFVESILDEDLEGQKLSRADFIKSKIAPHWQGVKGSPSFPATTEGLDQFLNAIGDADPSRNGAYMQWIAKMVLRDPAANRTEDLPTITDNLAVFDRPKVKNKLDVKDINQYKSFSDLYAAVASHMEYSEYDPAEESAVQHQIITIYRDGSRWIKVPTTKRASIYLGKNTNWCTARTDSANKFDDYAHGPKRDYLFVLYDPSETDPKKTRCQLHIAEKEFATTTNHNLGLNAVPEWARKPIAEFYLSKKDPHRLQLIYVKLFSKWLGEDISKQTDHNDLLTIAAGYDDDGKPI